MLTRVYGTLAGLGFIGAALLAVPSTLLLDPAPQASSYLVTVAGVVTGLTCMSLPWARIDARWLNLFGVMATTEAAVAVAVFGQPYVAFFFLIALAVAYVAQNRTAVAAHVALIGVALLGPVAYGTDSARSTVQLGLVIFPLLALTAFVVTYLRLRMAADHRSYRLFAEETLVLATRIAGRPIRAANLPDDQAEVPTWSRQFEVSSRALAMTAAILALPLLTAGFAAAGVRLPAFAVDSFGGIGIDLPNQAEAKEVPEPAGVPAGGSFDDPGNGGSAAPADGNEEPGMASLNREESSAELGTGGDGSDAASPESSATTPQQSPSYPNDAPPEPTGGDSGGNPGGGPMDGPLGGPLDDIQDLLGGGEG